jgi:OmpA-OmpF porin, OOP family
MASKMAPDLFNQLINEFRGETLSRLSSAIGETPAKIQSTLGSLAPALLSGFASRASTTDGANDVIDVIRRNNLTSVTVDDLATPSGVTNLVNSGRSFVDLALGSKVDSVIDWISNHVGISRSSVTSLANVCAPLTLGLIGRRLGGGLSASTLSSLLGRPNRFLQSAPAGLLTALGLTGASDTVRRSADDTDKRVAAAPVYESERPSSPWKWLLPLLLAAAAIGLFAYLLARRQPPPTTVATTQPAARTDVAPAPVAPAPVAPASSSTDLGAFVDIKLPNGVNLHIPSNGVESKLLAFIGDSGKAVDKETWFSFDRLEFETDSAKLKPSSREQLSNIAEILKAYPAVSVKIGSYTDNTGNPSHNLKLSQDRATSTLNELASLGISKGRLAAEGYGQQFPVADNATEEGRQRNRRIDIRVTKK